MGNPGFPNDHTMKKQSDGNDGIVISIIDDTSVMMSDEEETDNESFDKGSADEAPTTEPTHKSHLRINTNLPHEKKRNGLKKDVFSQLEELRLQEKRGLTSEECSCVWVVAKDLPVQVIREEKGFKVYYRPGHIHPSMHRLRRHSQFSLPLLFIGMCELTDDDVTEEEKKQIAKLLSPLGCFPIFPPKALYEGFLHFSNKFLWPLLHNVVLTSHQKIAFSSTDFSAYRSINQLWSQSLLDLMRQYAKEEIEVEDFFPPLALCPLLSLPSLPSPSLSATSPPANNPLVFIHDFHLLLLPELIKKNTVCGVGLSLQVPFCPGEQWRLLPFCKDVLRAILHADIIGFNFFEYAYHFLMACKRILRLEIIHFVGGELGVQTASGHITMVRTGDTTIDFSKLYARIRTPRLIQTPHPISPYPLTVSPTPVGLISTPIAAGLNPSIMTSHVVTPVSPSPVANASTPVLLPHSPSLNPSAPPLATPCQATRSISPCPAVSKKPVLGSHPSSGVFSSPSSPSPTSPLLGVSNHEPPHRSLSTNSQHLPLHATHPHQNITGSTPNLLHESSLLNNHSHINSVSPSPAPTPKATNSSDFIYQNLRKKYENKTVLVSIDFAERLSGVIIKLDTIREYLSVYSSARNEFVLIQLLLPTEKHFEDSGKYWQEVEKAGEEINKSYGEHIHLRYGALPDELKWAVFRIGNAYLDCSLRTGLNLFPFEYLSCRLPPSISPIPPLSPISPISPVSPLLVSPITIPRETAFPLPDPGLSLDDDLSTTDSYDRKIFDENHLTTLQELSTLHDPLIDPHPLHKHLSPLLSLPHSHLHSHHKEEEPPSSTTSYQLFNFDDVLEPQFDYTPHQKPPSTIPPTPSHSSLHNQIIHPEPNLRISSCIDAAIEASNIHNSSDIKAKDLIPSSLLRTHIVISEFTGSSKNLASAIRINPSNKKDLVHALDIIVSNKTAIQDDNYKKKIYNNYRNIIKDKLLIDSSSYYKWFVNFLVDLNRTRKQNAQFHHLSSGLEREASSPKGGDSSVYSGVDMAHDSNKTMSLFWRHSPYYKSGGAGSVSRSCSPSYRTRTVEREESSPGTREALDSPGRRDWIRRGLSFSPDKRNRSGSVRIRGVSPADSKLSPGSKEGLSPTFKGEGVSPERRAESGEGVSPGRRIEIGQGVSPERRVGEETNKRLFIVDEDVLYCQEERKYKDPLLREWYWKKSLAGCEVIEDLQAMCEDDNNVVVLVSNKSRDTLDNLYGSFKKLNLYSNSSYDVVLPSYGVENWMSLESLLHIVDKGHEKEKRGGRNREGERTRERSRDKARCGEKMLVSKCYDMYVRPYKEAEAFDGEVMSNQRDGQSGEHMDLEESLEESGENWKVISHALMEKYSLRVPNSYLQNNEASLIFNYSLSDLEFGELISKELVKYLTSLLFDEKHKVDIVHHRGYVKVKARKNNDGLFIYLLATLHAQRQLSLPLYMVTLGSVHFDDELYYAMDAMHEELMHSKKRERREDSNAFRSCCCNSKYRNHYYLTLHAGKNHSLALCSLPSLDQLHQIINQLAEQSTIERDMKEGNVVTDETISDMLAMEKLVYYNSKNLYSRNSAVVAKSNIGLLED